MRVGAVCVTEQISGGEIFLLELLEGLNALEGFDVSVVSNSDLLLDGARRRGLNCRPVEMGPKLSRRSARKLVLDAPRQYWRLRHVMDRELFDFVIVQYKLEQLLLARGRYAKIFLEHGPLPEFFQRPPLRQLYRWRLRQAQVVLSASHPASADLRLLGAQPTLLRAGVAGPRRRAARQGAEAIRESLLQSSNSTVLLAYAGRLTEAKGVLRAIDLALSFKDVHIWLAGHGPLEAQVSAIAKTHRQVTFAGAVPDPMPYLAAADACLLLTEDHGEGRPLTVLEALSVGTPVIAYASSAAMQEAHDEFGSKAIKLLHRGDTVGDIKDLGLGPIGTDIPDWSVAVGALAEIITAQRSASTS